MKKLIILCISLLLLSSCRSIKKNKTEDVVKTELTENVNINIKLDSIVKVLNKSTQKYQEQTLEKINQTTSDLELRFEPKFDSLGKLIPLNFERIVNGKVKESIKSSGGQIIYTSSNNVKDVEKNVTIIDERMDYLESEIYTLIDKNIALQQKYEALEKSMSKEVESTGFKWWWWLLIIVLLFLSYRFIFYGFKRIS
jgi:Fe2+ transport system protein B